VAGPDRSRVASTARKWAKTRDPVWAFCRDVFNEKPSTEVAQVEEGEDEDHPDALPRGAVIHTTRGDISVKLFPTECPRTVQNFATHARDGYYSGVLFHRVIKGFCIQTGDPLGNPPPPPSCSCWLSLLAMFLPLHRTP
jgi:hypothetical protein